MDRRTLLKSAAAAGMAGMAGCSVREDALNADSHACDQFASHDDIFRVDVHCHLVNHRDANGAAFIARRYLPDNVFLDLFGGLVVRTAAATVGLGTDAVSTEIQELNRWFGKEADFPMSFPKQFEEMMHLEEHKELLRYKDYAPFSRDGQFCRFGNLRQKGVYMAGSARSQQDVGSGRSIGFATGHLRNAAIMMAFWPNVDLFTPLMLDFYEGRGGGTGARPEERAQLYKALNLATQGRFVPLISFNPERQLKESPGEGRIKPLELVRRAIEDWGFIGVKVHPTAGFNPIDNFRWGCPNTALQVRARLTAEEALGYDRAMDQLYQLCDDLDVPIITHGSDGLSSHEACMHGLQPEHFIGNGKDPTLPEEYTLADSKELYNKRYNEDLEQRIVYRHPATWTNSPLHWREMLERGETRKHLRVCIAHYASRFQNHLSAKRGFADQKYDLTPGIEEPRPYHERPDTLPPVEYDPQGNLVPSMWLDTAVKAIEGGEERLWLDLSHMTALAYSEASRRRTLPKDSPLRVEVKKQVYDDGGRYALAFKEHLARHSALHSRVMYGSDWHMPDVSAVGPSYLDLIESTLPENCRRDVMGLNAARFFGLEIKADGTKGRNRQRLEQFYDDHKVPHPKWMKKLTAGATELVRKA